MAEGKLGRPTDYSEEVVAAICGRIADGESLRSICASEGMPTSSTVFLWLQRYPTFSEKYAQAREAQADALADEIQDIADDATNDWMQSNDPDNPGYAFNGEHVQRSKLRVEARKWIASKLKPKKYGDLKQVEHSGSVTLKELIEQSKQDER